ncbi:G-protein coupled receptor dmsr-1-like [Babylonia areolata]|uniref:G-protein coupled receptor dmsr-1-like n=1 Tax=Babylonia areolata TaxID=304850 RepID=UPI003FCF5C29
MTNINDIYTTHYDIHNATSSVQMDMNVTQAQMTTVSTTKTHSAIKQFGLYYQTIHGYLSVFICVFGIVFNAINISVLASKRMVNPTNFILTALAIADMLTMITYPITAIYLYIITGPNCDKNQRTWGFMSFMLILYCFLVTSHTWTMWLTVVVALYRNMFMYWHSLATRVCNMEHTKQMVAVVMVFNVAACVPYYLAYSVQNVGPMWGHNVSCYSIVDSQLSQDSPVFKKAVSWWFGTVIKILPCVLLVVLSAPLIMAIQKVRKQRITLINTTSSTAHTTDHDLQSREQNRTTLMLLAVVICFIVTEFPQGVLAWIYAEDKDFGKNVYYHIGELLDLLVLVNSAVNFIFYCVWSQKFRANVKL